MSNINKVSIIFYVFSTFSCIFADYYSCYIAFLLCCILSSKSLKKKKKKKKTSATKFSMMFFALNSLCNTFLSLYPDLSYPGLFVLSIIKP